MANVGRITKTTQLAKKIQQSKYVVELHTHGVARAVAYTKLDKLLPSRLTAQVLIFKKF